MPFEHTHSHDSSMDNQSPTSPMDTSFSSTPSSPMDLDFNPTSSPTVATATSPCVSTSPFAHHHPIPVVTPSNPPEPQSQQPTNAPFGARRAEQNAAFREKLRQMALPLAPLVQLTSGDVHPRFPGTLLNFWLLTDAELESLAYFYHQRTPSRWTAHYPCPVAPWDSSLPLEEKRRKIGKFIGLRGCETPVVVRSEEELLEEARLARLAAEEEVWRRKLHWY